MKFKFIVVLLCCFMFTGTVSGLAKGNEDHPVFVTKEYLTDYINERLVDYNRKGIEGETPVLMEAPADAVIGQRFISAGSGVLCTLCSEMRMGNLYTFWSKNGYSESFECLPVIDGAPPQILFYDPPETIQVYPEKYINKVFSVAFPDAYSESGQGSISYNIKVYIIDTKTGITFKTNQFSGIAYRKDPLERVWGSIGFNPEYGLFVQMHVGQDYSSSYLKFFDLRAAGSGVYNFVIEAIDQNNNSGYAAIPINVQYMGE